MDILPTVEDETLALEIYRKFRRRPGAERIASAFALAHLAAILRQRRPRSVLEIGAGIGTVTALLLEHPSGVDRVVATENHPFCLEQLECNLDPGSRGRLRLVETEESFAEVEGPFDLLIIDGNWNWPAVAERLREGAVCFAEGQRRWEREALDVALRRHRLGCAFDGHIQGYRFVLDWRFRSPARRIAPLPRLRLGRRPVKGCWIGEVTPR